MRSVCTRQVGQPEGVGSLLPGMYLSPRALEMEAPPHLLSSPGQWVGKPRLRYSLPTCHRTDSKAGVPPPPAISPAPFPEGTVLSPKPAPSCTLVPVHPTQSSPRARFPEMKRKKTLMMSPRCVLQPCWHSCSLRAGCRAGPGVSLRPAIPGPGPGTPRSGQLATAPAPSLSVPSVPSPQRKALRASVLEPSLPPLSVSPSQCRPCGSRPSLCLGLSALSCRPLCFVHTSPALGLSQDRLPPSPALPLAPDPGSSGPGCSRSLETAGLLQLPGLGGCEGGVGPVPESRHPWGRCPCVIFNPGCDHAAEGPYPGHGASLQPGRELPCPRPSARLGGSGARDPGQSWGKVAT